MRIDAGTERIVSCKKVFSQLYVALSDLCVFICRSAEVQAVLHVLLYHFCALTGRLEISPRNCLLSCCGIAELEHHHAPPVSSCASYSNGFASSTSFSCSSDMLVRLYATKQESLLIAVYPFRVFHALVRRLCTLANRLSALHMVF